MDWPASDPLVTGVGGTRLRLTAGGSRLSPDSAWNESGNLVVARYAGTLPWASSGGASAIFTRPAYQDPVRTVVGNRRGVPDVALGLHTRLGLVNPLLYRLEQARTPGIVHVTQGSNTISFRQDRKTITVTGDPARPGYDLVTGVATIDAARFVRALRALLPAASCPQHAGHTCGSGGQQASGRPAFCAPAHPDLHCGTQAPS